MEPFDPTTPRAAEPPRSTHVDPRDTATRRVASALVTCGALTAALVCVLFGRVVTHPFIAFDDAELILRNPQVIDPFRSWADQLLTPQVGYVVPVTVGVEALLYALSDGAAWSFHAAALALHALCAVQLLAFARRVGARPTAALVSVLVFAVHPLVVQPVAWAICLKDLLMANLVLAATARWLMLSDNPVLARGGGAHAAAAVALALAAMLAKPSAALLGFAWLAYLGARRLSGGAVAARALHASAITSALGLVVGVASRYAHDAVMGVDAAPGWTPSRPLAVLGSQLRHALWPADLLVMYPAPSGGFSAPDAWLGLLGLLGAVVLAVRSRARPAVVLLLALATATYLPTSNVLPFARVMSDSYMYLPLAALCVLGALAAGSLTLRSRMAVRALAVLIGTALVALATLSQAQLHRWRGGAALWQPVLEAHPDFADAHRLLGDEHIFRGEHALAIEPYRRFFALAYDPRYLGEFGAALSMAGRVEDAECVLVEAFVIGTDPGAAAYNYAVLLAFHADYAPHEPAVAKHILARLDELRLRGAVRWPSALDRGLAAQRERLRDLTAALPTWRRRTCAIFSKDSAGS